MRSGNVMIDQASACSLNPHYTPLTSLKQNEQQTPWHERKQTRTDIQNGTETVFRNLAMFQGINIHTHVSAKHTNANNLIATSPAKLFNKMSGQHNYYTQICSRTDAASTANANMHGKKTREYISNITLSN